MKWVAETIFITHISCVRGSPLLRTFLILILLLGSGTVFLRLTAKGESAETPPPVAEKKTGLIPAKFYLTISTSSSAVVLTNGEKPFDLATEDHMHFFGSGAIDPSNPILFLKISSPSQKSRAALFAKLVVEAEGTETFTHVFDSPGEIDDFVELPF